MFDDKQNISVNGVGNKTAGRDLIDNSTVYNTYLHETIKHESAIGNILLKLSSFTSEIEYEKSDTKEYTIEDYDVSIALDSNFKGVFNNRDLAIKKIAEEESNKT